MLLRDQILEHLPSNAEDNARHYNCICFNNVSWTVSAIENIQDPIELSETLGVFAIRDTVKALDFASKLGKENVNGRFDINPYYLLHVTGTSFCELVSDYKDSDYEFFVRECLKALDARNESFDGIHFVKDGVVFIKKPAARMCKNSFSST